MKVAARTFVLAHERGRLTLFGHRFGRGEEIEEVVAFVECPFCWALTMPDKAEAHATLCDYYEPAPEGASGAPQDTEGRQKGAPDLPLPATPRHSREGTNGGPTRRNTP